VQNTNIIFVDCCLGANKTLEKLKVEDSVGSGDLIPPGAVPFGGPQWQAKPLGMNHLEEWSGLAIWQV
jgi:hypothetical protein